MALDGSCFELPDEADNVEAFGRPGSRTGFSAYPQARCAVLVECATHAVLGANLAPYRTEEFEVCRPLLERLGPDMLCLADRGFDGFEYWRQARATGAQLLWRCMKSRRLPVLRRLDDGSYISAICPPKVGRAQAAEQAQEVRVIEYSLPGVPSPNGHAQTEPRYRLITSLLDPQAAPAAELAALYHQRWHVGAVFDELKTHLLGGRRVLRSKKAELVRQEFYGWVLAHYAVRWLLHQGASRHPEPHATRFFAGHVHLLRRTQPHSGGLSPPGRARKRRRWFNDLLDACRKLRAVRTLGRRNSRMVKRRNSPFKSHDRHLAKHVPADTTPRIIEPPTMHRSQQPMRPHLMRRFGFDNP